MTRDERRVIQAYRRAEKAICELAALGEWTELESSIARDALNTLAIHCADRRDWINGDRDPMIRERDGTRRPRPGTFAAKVARALGVRSR